MTFCLRPSICVSALALVPFLSLPSALRSPPPPPPPPPLQACKPNHSAEGGGSGQSLPPHVGSLGQAEDQSCPAKRRRASSPSKVSTTVTASFIYPLLSNSTDVYSFHPTCYLYFQSLLCVFRVIPGLVTQHSSQFPTGTSPRRNYKFVISYNNYLHILLYL